MQDEKASNQPDDPVQEEMQRRRDTRRAIAFGVAMATIQMGAVLYFMYC